MQIRTDMAEIFKFVYIIIMFFIATNVEGNPLVSFFIFHLFYLVIYFLISFSISNALIKFLLIFSLQHGNSDVLKIQIVPEIFVEILWWQSVCTQYSVDVFLQGIKYRQDSLFDVII